MSFTYREPGKIIRDILVAELELEDSQAMFTNQKFFIPTDGIFINVSYVGPAKALASVNEWVDDGGDGLTEIQSIAMAHLVQIDILGYGNDVRTRKEEIVMALRSILSQQMQEQYNMQIARQPGGMMDTSFLEETKMITRYTMTVMTSSVNEKRKAIDSYTGFQVKAYTDVAEDPFTEFNAQDEPAVLAATH